MKKQTGIIYPRKSNKCVWASVAERLQCLCTEENIVCSASADGARCVCCWMYMPNGSEVSTEVSFRSNVPQDSGCRGEHLRSAGWTNSAALTCSLPFDTI